VIDKDKSKVVDKGKGKMVVPEKPKKAEFIPLQTGGAFKIYKPKDLVPPAPLVTQPAKKSLVLKNKPVNTSPLVARLLKLVDEEEELEAQQPLEATLRPISLVPTPSEESEVKVIEAPLVKKRKLVKGVEAVAPTVDEAQNVANFLSAWREWMPIPSVPCMAEVEAFLANEPIEVNPVNLAKPALEEPL
jgi:hypothetical protein